MRRIALFLLCALLCGCGTRSPQADSPAESRQEMDSDGGGADNLEMTDVRERWLSTDCVMTTEYPAYSPDVDTVTVLLENRSEEWVETGAPFTLEVDLGQGGEFSWFRLEPAGGDELSWIAIAYTVAPGGTLALQCNLDCYDRSIFTGGHFRIVKSVGEGICTAEFTVSEDAPITAERPYGFGPLAEIPVDYAPETAAEEGCVVFAMGQSVQNGKAMETFLTKASLGMSCQLRLARFRADGALSVEDVIHEKVPGIGGRLTYRRWENGTAESDRYFSFLHTDGWTISLSNALVWNDDRAGGSQPLLAGDEAAPYMAAVQAWADGLAESNATRCRVWNGEGSACGGLDEEPLSFSVCTPGRGMAHAVPDVPDTAEITAIDWQDEDTLCLTVTDSLTGEGRGLLWNITSENWIR